MLTREGQAALDRAAAIAHSRQHPTVEPLDLLTALLTGPPTLVQATLRASAVDLESLARAVHAPATLPRAGRDLPQPAPATNAIVGYAFKEAQHLGHSAVDAIHLLMGMLYDTGTPVYPLLTEAGITLYGIREELVRRHVRMPKPSAPATGRAIRPSPIFFIPLLLMLGSGYALYTDPQEAWVKPLTFLFAIAGWVTALSVHEFGHAIVAYFGGDTSVRDQGYLTLNPLKYTHPFYSLVIPLIFVLSGGIGLPGAAVYINRFALRNAWWDRFTSAGGPLGTLLFIFLTTWPFALPWWEWLTDANIHFWRALAFMGFLQVTALIFNLIPLPPLDGWGMIAPSFPWEMRVRVSQYGSFSLLLLFLLLNSNSGITDQFWSLVLTVANLFNLPTSLILQGFQQFSLW
jgi:Zn-dependent protease